MSELPPIHLLMLLALIVVISVVSVARYIRAHEEGEQDISNMNRKGTPTAPDR